MENLRSVLSFGGILTKQEIVHVAASFRYSKLKTEEHF